MIKKTLLTGLLVSIFVSSCIPATLTAVATDVPLIQSPTSTKVITPTHPINISLTKIAETQTAELVEPYQFSDAPVQNLRKLNRILGESLIETLWFNEATLWSIQDKPIAQNILELGMNPGLGVRALHAEGVTGKGVNVAIIDQPVVLDHPEFQGKIIKYHDVGTGTYSGQGSMHGSAVTSLLVGENVGTAPDARVYYVAVPSWLLDAQYFANALDWIVAENEMLPIEDKIRLVSVSSIPSGLGSEYTNTAAWESAYQRAGEAGILVLDCSYENGVTAPCTFDLHDPEDPSKCIPGWPGIKGYQPVTNRIYIPTSKRSSATEYVVNNEVVFAYQYTGVGGISWTVPYLSGVLAMGWQINPELSSDQLLDMIFASAYKLDSSANVINPRKFIEMVRQTIEE